MSTPRSIVIVSAGVSEPSSTRLLADRLAQKTLELLTARGVEATVGTVDLRALVADIGQATLAGFPSDNLRAAFERLAAADAVIAATPVYKAGISGLFKSFIDVLDDDLLIAKPVALAATAGSERHSLVPDEQMRPLFAYLRALVTPTSLFATPQDWADRALSDRIARTATELAALVASGVSATIAGETWHNHRHEFATTAPRSANTSALDHVDLESDLMRLATGGHSRTTGTDRR
ncbi:CE1759 family FMN reductase [Nocardia sp. XZ_19_385]|uniref:CE1759 family FMN reductase n=1 Tax=Nocardia sp. XZ_19_385 TaxID=2769488 RepID=UPI00188F053C|nr:CE1759 family FMN reductase [Nocardia sp. XZ_19_385]